MTGSAQDSATAAAARTIPDQAQIKITDWVTGTIAAAGPDAADGLARRAR